MAGDSGKHHGASDLVLLVEENAKALMADVDLQILTIEAADGSGPDTMRVHPATVDKALCAHCLACIKLCPSLTWDTEKARVIVNEVSCKGCGICGSVCPTGAISQRQFSPGMILDALGRIWDGEGNGEEITNCGSCPVEPLGARMAKKVELGGYPVRIICSGRAEPIQVLESLQLGVHGILMVDCFSNVKQKERFEKGRKRLESGQSLLRTLGSGSVQVEAANISSDNINELGRALSKFSGHRGGDRA
jgi:Pyruvate/2-oxoacid:ferredoxin oxidoreductase delta subunit/coenzyme F420-reducing hydrogenase delta subunit